MDHLHDDTLLTEREVVETFRGLGLRWLQVARVRGNGPPFLKVGRAVRYRLGDVRQWIAECRAVSTSGEDRGLRAAAGARTQAEKLRAQAQAMLKHADELEAPGGVAYPAPASPPRPARPGAHA